MARAPGPAASARTGPVSSASMVSISAVNASERRARISVSLSTDKSLVRMGKTAHAEEV